MLMWTLYVKFQRLSLPLAHVENGGLSQKNSDVLSQLLVIGPSLQSFVHFLIFYYVRAWKESQLKLLE
jgi:hypothetical protein